MADRETRSLRSKERTSVKEDTSLFNYEEHPDLVDPEQVIQVVESHQPKADDEVLREATPTSIGIQTKLVLITDDDDGLNGSRASKRKALRRSTVKKAITGGQGLKDPLSDDVYEMFHRRMEKEEKRMANRDRERIYSEADRMRAQLDRLSSKEWARSLPTITYIRDPRDSEEMLQKKKWTIDSLKMLLSRFEEYKTREDRLLGKDKERQFRMTRQYLPTNYLLNDLTFYSPINKADYVGDSDTDYEEDSMSVSDIRKNRKRKHVRRFGPVIKLKFGKSVVVAEPFKATRIDQLKK